MSAAERNHELKRLHSRLALAEPEVSDVGRWALVKVAPDERRGAPALVVTTHDEPLEAVLELAREGLGDLLYPSMPAEIVDLDSGISVVPQWERLAWAPAGVRR